MRNKFSSYDYNELSLQQLLNKYFEKLNEVIDEINTIKSQVILKSNIINELDTGGIENVLSAEQGKILKTLIDELKINADNNESILHDEVTNKNYKWKIHNDELMLERVD